MFKKSIIFSALLMTTTVVNAGSIEGLKLQPIGQPLGNVVVNPYEHAPLTAVVQLHGHEIRNVSVIVHKNDADGVSIQYPVSDKRIQEDGGVPIFGLYPDFYNTVTVKWTEGGEKKSHDYKILTPDIDMGFSGNHQWAKAPKVTPVKVDTKFKDRLYLYNWTSATPKDAQIAHNNNLAPGALAWDGTPGIFIADTAGDIRWYLNPHTTHNGNHREKAGYAMGFNVTDDGHLVYVQGQSYKKLTLTGRMVFDRSLPRGFIDASHEGIQVENGNYLLRVAKENYALPDGRRVNTIRDHIIEVDEAGNLVDVWDLNKILDPYRDAALLSLDAGAVCLNIDVDQAGHQVTEDDLKNAPFGDIPGVGPGRNWAHVNSIDYDPVDDSIIISSRHQSAVIKIGRDKEVKWILGPKVGWDKARFGDKLLNPVDGNGKTLSCTDNGDCGDKFEFSYTSHTAYKVDEKGTWTVFDNGDGRNTEQPAMPSMKYSRAVEYKIDEENMTVKQLWEIGKDRGIEFYSPITSIVKYQADKDSMMVYSASSNIFGVGGGLGNMKMDNTTGKVISYLVETPYGSKKPAVEIKVESNRLFSTGYRAQVIIPNF
ncbi:aryl-sulfate sulfotransferase [Shewanella sp. KX20019]|uniref:aryl-sulfate sulfotransferase n=1 Tax=Shewanella sp. KX20019 TaxID=2803864 RepID=UPI0019297DF3|nr:aryl-sulfate sulfotransferase [Shewanella sp. KX20019]QQX80876.1 aryl-sulfate sulfotransferase [Shewanella sp. KX20019]